MTDRRAHERHAPAPLDLTDLPPAPAPKPLALGCPDCGAQVFVRERIAICEKCGRRWDWRKEAKDVTFANGEKT